MDPFFLIPEYTFGIRFKETLMNWGFSTGIASYIVDFFGLFVVFAISVIVYFILRFFIRRILKRLVLRSTSKWDDYLFENKVFTRLALIVPAIIIHLSLSSTISAYPVAIHLVDVVLEIYSVLIIMLVINSFLNALCMIYNDLSTASSKPIKGYVQIARIIVLVIGGIIITSFLLGQSPLSLLAGLGAISAILLLIFKDSILGFVAGVQISTNNMLQIGDWMSMPNHNVDGVVVDISLVIVKVRNFDNSIVTVPTYSLISESFQNWRGLYESGGRRIKRSVLIDIRSIVPVNTVFLKKMEKFNLQELSHQTNLGFFRQYMLGYLRQHHDINQQMVILVRHQQGGDNGLPLEIYAFSVLEDITVFENFQSNLFEHIISIAPEFDLLIYQKQPSLGSRE